MDQLGRRIRKERKASGLTLEALAKIVGSSRATLQRIETGVKPPSVALLSQISNVLRKPIDELIREERKAFYRLEDSARKVPRHLVRVVDERLDCEGRVVTPLHEDDLYDAIAWIDDGGLLQVRPRSAGADPGPVCYDRGGTEPTVTDADLLLGYLDPEFFFGGEFRLNRARAERQMRKEVSGIPDGEYYGEQCIDHDGIERDRMITIRLTVKVKGDTIVFDYTGTDPQTKGPFNSPMAATASHTYLAFFACLGPGSSTMRAP